MIRRLIFYGLIAVAAYYGYEEYNKLRDVKMQADQANELNRQAIDRKLDKKKDQDALSKANRARQRAEREAKGQMEAEEAE